MSLITALKSFPLHLIGAGKPRKAGKTELLDHDAMLAELRGLFADELADHDRSARKLALESASQRPKK